MSNIKRAILCGLNYIGSDLQLNGCINDATNMKQILIDHYGYKPNNIMLMTDYTAIKPTKQNIMKYLQKLINDAGKYCQLVFHYSGHGSYLKDQNNDEIDHKDECLVPLDYKKNGMIRDDDIKKIVQNLHPTAQLTMIIDACHSGTMIDLKYQLDCLSVTQNSRQMNTKKCNDNNDNKTIQNNDNDDNNDNSNDNDEYIFKDWTYDYKLSEDSHYNFDTKCGKIISISGCRDNQTSADAYINRTFQGALSYVFLTVLKLNGYKHIKLKYLLKDMHCILKINNYEQKPVIQSSKPILLNSLFFL